MTDTRHALIDDYVSARLQFGDLDDEQEDMSPAELRRHLRNYAETLTNEQLASACSSYAMAE